MTLIAVLPLRVPFKEWAHQLRVATPGFYFPIAWDVSEWRGWGEEVVLTNNFVNVPIPTKNVYPEEDDWRRWGAFLIQTIYSTNI
jgi:hypothetical protein